MRYSLWRYCWAVSEHLLCICTMVGLLGSWLREIPPVLVFDNPSSSCTMITNLFGQFSVVVENIKIQNRIGHFKNYCFQIMLGHGLHCHHFPDELKHTRTGVICVHPNAYRRQTWKLTRELSKRFVTFEIWRSIWIWDFQNELWMRLLFQNFHS